MHENRLDNRVVFSAEDKTSVNFYDFNSDKDSNVIEVFVGRLRRKIDPQGTMNPIETLRGRGYRLNKQPHVA